MSASSPPPPTSADHGGPLVLRFGAAVGLAAVASLACALPAAIRVAGSAVGTDRSIAHVWAALAAASLGPMLAAVITLRAAREGLRAFAGPGAALRVYGAGLWLAWIVVALALFGAVLRRTTHQHALAGVTFAGGAVAIALGAGLVCARIVAILRDAAPGARRTGGAALGAITAAALGWTGLAFLRAVAGDPASAAAAGMVLDTLAFVLAAFLVSRRFGAAPGARRTLAVIGPPVAVAVAALGGSGLHDAALRHVMGERAPAFATAIDLVRGL